MLAVLRVAIAVALGFEAQAFGAEPHKVAGIRFWSLDDTTRIAVEVSGPVRFRADRADSPPRLFFDILDAVPTMARRGIHTVPVGDALVRQVRVAEYQPGTTRVVLDLNTPAEYTVSDLVNPDRLMIEVRRAGAKTVPTTPAEPAEATPAKPAPKVFVPPAGTPGPRAQVLLLPPPAVGTGRMPAVPRLLAGRQKPPGPPPLPKPVQPAEDPKPLPVQPSKPVTSSVTAAVSSATLPPVAPDAVPTPAKRNATTGDRSMTRVLGLKIGRVVIDPGHGGHDFGTTGPKGLHEKDLVLDVAKRLGELVEKQMGSEVIYTRTDDRFIALEARTELANEVRADLFLSIHANSSPLATASGSETFFLSFTTSRADLEVAARENAASQRSVFELKEMLERIALRDKVDESREFAAKVQSALYGMYAKGNPKLRNRGVKKAPFVVLIGASMPSVLAEVGFVSNPREEALLKKPDQRQKIAEALFRGVSNYAGTLSHFEVAKREE